MTREQRLCQMLTEGVRSVDEGAAHQIVGCLLAVIPPDKQLAVLEAIRLLLTERRDMATAILEQFEPSSVN